MLRRRGIIGDNSGGSNLPNYLCFTALESGTFTFTIGSAVAADKVSYVEYSIGNKETWVRTNNVNSTQIVITTPTILAGEKVYWRGSATNYAVGVNSTQYSNFSSIGKFEVSGNLGSLLDPTLNYSPITTGYTFAFLFAGNSNLIYTNNLILCKTASSGYRYGQYRNMFEGCSSLVNAPNLSIVEFLGSDSFRFMFKNCSSLETAPELPFTSLNGNCYDSMFVGCTSLTITPKLPATTLASGCYNEMFKGCTALTTVDTILATNLGGSSCMAMFFDCSSLVNVPDININSLSGENCVRQMFKGCSSLVHCPIKSIPNNTVSSCYYLLFQSCTALEDIFDMPAETLTSYCYGHILSGNGKVNRIKMLATDISASNCVVGMKDNGASTGLFIKNINATWNNSDVVHSGWTVIYYDTSEDKYYLDQSKTTECDENGNPI